MSRIRRVDKVEEVGRCEVEADTAAGTVRMAFECGEDVWHITLSRADAGKLAVVIGDALRTLYSYASGPDSKGG